jgi:hypothetical protein
MSTRSFVRSVAPAAGALAAASGAHADIVYFDFQDLIVASGSSLSIDIDQDGFNDLRLKNYNFGGGAYQGADVTFFPGRLTSFLAGPSNLAYVSNLAFGAPINASNTGVSFFGSMAYGASNPNAQFNNATDAYIGLSFPTGPNLFYAWVRVDVNNAARTLTIKDWAYQSVSNVGITAGAIPSPGALGLLALGAVGVAGYRQRRS